MSESEQKLEIDFGKRPNMKKKSKNSSNKRRFSEEQVKWLENLFQNEAKLEPRQKADVATQLGLHPRQVAIWFQNKRARWKSKQLQQDFDGLRRNYDALAARFELLKRENHSLSLQVQKFKDLVGKTQEQGKMGDGVNDQECENNNSNNDNIKGKEKKPGLLTEGEGTEYAMGVLRDDEICQQNSNYFGMEESAADLLAMVEPTCSSLTSDEDWHSLQSDGLFDRSPSSCEWWDFWS